MMNASLIFTVVAWICIVFTGLSLLVGLWCAIVILVDKVRTHTKGKE